MKTPILALAGSTTGPSNTANRFFGMAGGGAGLQYSTNAIQNPVVHSGTISRLIARVGTPLAQGSYTITLQVNGVDTALSVTLDTSNQQAIDITNSVTVNSTTPDLIGFKIVPAGTPTAQTVIQVSCLLDSTTAGKSMLFAVSNVGTTGGFIPVGGAGTGSTEGVEQVPMPTTGATAKLGVKLTAAPGTGNSRTFTVRKNGVDTGLTLTISDTSTQNVIDLGASPITWAEGDLVSLNMTVGGTPASATAAVTIGWTPDIDGEALMFTRWSGSISSSVPSFANANGRSASGEQTETNTYNVVPTAFTVKKLHAVVATAPGAGKSRTLTLRDGPAGSVVSTALSASLTTIATASDNTHTATVASGDLLDFQSTPSGTPAATSTFAGSAVAMVSAATPSSRRHRNLLLLDVG